MPRLQENNTVANLLDNANFSAGKPTKDKVASISGVNFIKLSIKAGDELPTHHVNKAAFAVLLQGKAKFPIYDTTHEVTPGAFLEIPKDADHSVVAQEDSIFLVGIIGHATEDER